MSELRFAKWGIQVSGLHSIAPSLVTREPQIKFSVRGGRESPTRVHNRQYESMAVSHTFPICSCPPYRPPYVGELERTYANFMFVIDVEFPCCIY